MRQLAHELGEDAAEEGSVEGRLVALLGVEDLAVVDTEDVILVTKLERSSDVRRLVEKLRDPKDRSLT